MNDNSIISEARKLNQNGKAQEALALLNAARIKQNSAELLIEIANVLNAMHLPEAAFKILEEGLRSFANDASLVIAYANHAYTTNQPEIGLNITHKFVQSTGCSSELLITHAHLLKANGNIREAETFYKKALAIDPRNAIALSSLGGIEMDSANYAEALNYFRAALAANPNNPHIQTQLAYCEFRSGDLAHGWQHYDARFASIVKPRSFAIPRWNGKKLQHGKLLIWGEQGAGEEILYSSMLNDARSICPDGIVVECDERLKVLFERSFQGITFIPRRDPPNSELTQTSIAAQCSAGQLGEYLRYDFKHYPKQNGYLKADDRQVNQLKARYEGLKKQYGKTGRIIGVSWKSKPLRQGDPKSSSIADWSSILEHSPHLFISLQYGDIADDLALAKKHNWALIDDAEINQRISLDDFAAQVSAMDEVITVSNTTAHMAGACGIKTAILLPRSRGLMWHWFDIETLTATQPFNTSPWYASATLLRQETDGTWHDVLLKVKAGLNSN